MVDAEIIIRGEIIKDPRLSTLLNLLKDLPLPHEYDFTFPETPVLKGIKLLDLLQSYVDEDVSDYLTAASNDAFISAFVNMVCMREKVLAASEKPILNRKALFHACQQQIRRMQIVKTLLKKT